MYNSFIWWLGNPSVVLGKRRIPTEVGFVKAVEDVLASLYAATKPKACLSRVFCFAAYPYSTR